MPIVAVSMTDDDLEELEYLLTEGKFSNRSDVVRHAVQTLMSEHRNIELAQGQITAVIIAVYYTKGEGHNISSVQHEYRKFIAATIHAHTSDDRCTEIMILTGDAEEVRGFLKKLRSQKKVMKINISLVGGGK
ncbi:MAG: CopG family ribbon-helix-helix protein [Candidatus Thorarchaeota archaeon]|nr:CopG family ribbon-helix-helix protein [Candidatus Thorarchaeota archaeon]TFH11503.1 MAG: CopG family ribbon-helix-helix protein [Candidatus Thorarchaeota archaeon]